MKLLIIYLLIINVSAFAAFGIDKRKAVRGRWRISERALLLLCLLGGSAGGLIGMYFFHHKTRKLKFVIGVPLILALELIAFLLIHYGAAGRQLSPSGTVSAQLDLIRDLDPETVELLMTGSKEPSSSSEETSPASSDFSAHLLDAARAFFRQFNYTIVSQDISSGSALVDVMVTNIDTRALAHDVCLDLSQMRLRFSSDSSSSPTADEYLDLITSHLSEGAYDLQQTQITFHLVRKKGSFHWTILTDQALTDALTGYFQDYINDPYILSAREVASQYLDSLSALSAQQWMDFLKPDDIFHISGSSGSDDLDRLYMEKIAACFDYGLESSSEDGDTATVQARITSIDMKAVFTLFKEKLLSYASGADSITDDSDTLSNSSAQYLAEALQQTSQTASAIVDIELENDGTAWQVVMSEPLTDALLGGLQSAVTVLQADR